MKIESLFQMDYGHSWCSKIHSNIQKDQTSSGSAFMDGFNSFYYSFSPTIADWERENPMLKETVKMAITPLLTSLSILNYVDMDSEAKVLGYGISLILLNIGMYFVAPAVAIIHLKKRFNFHLI